MPELKVEDLVEKCEQCGGTGNPDKIGPATFPECGLQNFDITGIPRCDECEGCGRGLTHTGEVIRDFVDWLLKTNQIKSPA